MSSTDPFRLKKVCADCPFRADVPFHGLTAERVTEIADALRGGATFHCHATLDYDRIYDTDDTGAEPSPVVPTSQFCAGALATMEKGHEPNQIARIAERLGMYAPEAFDWEAQPVYDGLDAWENALIDRATELTYRERPPDGMLLLLPLASAATDPRPRLAEPRRAPVLPRVRRSH